MHSRAQLWNFTSFSLQYHQCHSKHHFQNVSSKNLHAHSKTILESAEVRSNDGSASSDLNLRSNLPDETSGNNFVRSNLSLEISKRWLVQSSNSNNITSLGSRVSSAGCDGHVGVDLVHHADINSGQLVGSGNCGKERSLGVCSSNIESRKSTVLKAVRYISSKANSSSKSNTSRGGNWGQILDIKVCSSNKVSRGIIASEVSSLGSLEGKLESRGRRKGSLKGLTTTWLELYFIERKSSVGEFGSDLGRKRSILCTGSINGNSYGTCIFLALETDLAGVVIVEKVCIGLSKIHNSTRNMWRPNRMHCKYPNWTYQVLWCKKKKKVKWA